MSKENPVGTHNPRPSAINHAMWLIVVAGLTVELAHDGSISIWFSLSWLVVGIAMIPLAIKGTITALRNLLMADAMLALTIFSYFMIEGPDILFAMGILVGQIAFAVYLAYLTNRQILEYKRLEILYNES
tara:strand:- start:1131 stop:1520 length:390 start_codon:yes stop_codon:yes gene_type:complete